MSSKWQLASFGSMGVLVVAFASAFLVLGLADVFRTPFESSSNDLILPVHLVLSAIFAVLCLASWIVSLFSNSAEIDRNPLAYLKFASEWGRNFAIFVSLVFVFQLILRGIRGNIGHKELQFLIQLIQYVSLGLPVGIGLLVLACSVDLSKRKS